MGRQVIDIILSVSFERAWINDEPPLHTIRVLWSKGLDGPSHPLAKKHHENTKARKHEIKNIFRKLGDVLD